MFGSTLQSAKWKNTPSSSHKQVRETIEPIVRSENSANADVRKRPIRVRCLPTEPHPKKQINFKTAGVTNKITAIISGFIFGHRGVYSHPVDRLRKTEIIRMP